MSGSVRRRAMIAFACLLASGPALDSDTAFAILSGIGLVSTDAGGLPDRMAPFLALIAAFPAPLTERLLTELIARVVEPR